MTRRGFFGLAALASVGEHQHDFKTSPLFVTCAVTYEEPGFYPPGGLIPVELCACGAIRINPKTAAALAGKNYEREAPK